MQPTSPGAGSSSLLADVTIAHLHLAEAVGYTWRWFA